MERIISYNELPYGMGQSVYLRNETDPSLYVSLLSKGYRIVDNITNASHETIYITGRRQDFDCKSSEEYKLMVNSNIQGYLNSFGIKKPDTVAFNYHDLIEHKYHLPFVLKNENQNGGREKFLINTEEDYDNLIQAIEFLFNKINILKIKSPDDLRFRIDYHKYLSDNFTVQEYIHTPSSYNTTVRLLTSPASELLYGSLKYKEPSSYTDNTTLIGYLLSEVYPLSTKSIVSNTLRGGKNILLGESTYMDFEQELLNKHGINTSQFDELVGVSELLHQKYHSELGIICGFDYIYDREKQKWFLLEYHSRPMVGDYSRRQGLDYTTIEDRLEAEGRVRATALKLVLKKDYNNR